MVKSVMLCQIADLIVEVPAEGGLDSRCRDYLYSGQGQPDIVIRSEKYRPEKYGENWSPETIAYMESGWQFLHMLIDFDGMFLHASTIVVDGRAYLFSANSGVGKSTHTGLWKQMLGDRAQNINDDKPALRCLDGVWYAYGTPWCGKDGINQNKRVAVGGICFIQRGNENRIRPISAQEAIIRMMPQTTHGFGSRTRLTKLLDNMSKLLMRIPVFELTCLPNVEAAQLSYETMRRKAEEMGL